MAGLGGLVHCFLISPTVSSCLQLSLECGYLMVGLPWWFSGKDSACNAGDMGSVLGLGRSPGEGNGNPFQYSCLENPVDGGALWATVHGVAKSRTRLSDFAFFFFFHAIPESHTWLVIQVSIHTEASLEVTSCIAHM